MAFLPGYGGPLKDVPPEGFNSTAIPRAYFSPWEQALIQDPSLAETLAPKVPSPTPKPEGLEYKSFNRSVCDCCQYGGPGVQNTLK